MPNQNGVLTPEEKKSIQELINSVIQVVKSTEIQTRPVLDLIKFDY